MSRSAKQFAYGAFYLVLFLLILWGVFRALVPGPSCSDGILNGDEAGVDCGGPCAPCAKAQTEVLRPGTVQAFSTQDGRTVFLAQVINPNAAYAAESFSYSFSISDSSGRHLGDTPSKTGRIHASERRYLFEPEVPAQFSSADRAELTLSQVVWRKASELPRIDIAASGVATDVGSDGVRVLGAVKNQGPLTARGVKIVALLHDRVGVPLFAAQTVLDEIAGGETQAFPPIKFPSDESLARSVDPAATEIFVSGL
ncbi:MAG: hypothetical protein V1696_00780 [Candidatus Jorgensenbacteria bacterium]